MAGDNSKDQLVRLFSEYKTLKIPRGGITAVGLSELDVDLFEEDSYLAGLVDTYLRRGRLDLYAIQIDRTIDERLERAARLASGVDERYIRALNDYRSKMLELAYALECASGVSVRTRRATDCS